MPLTPSKEGKVSSLDINPYFLEERYAIPSFQALLDALVLGTHLLGLPCLSHLVV